MSDEKDLRVNWSSTDNIAWISDLPGGGASSPIVVGDRVFLTCYSGYGLDPNAGEQKKLVRHLLCFDRNSGQMLWKKEFQPKLPEHKYQGEGSYHGYAASTPATDGKRLYVFFGKSGVYCFNLQGEQLWQADLGDRTNEWGSGCSPVLYGKLVIVNASIESGSLVALDKVNGHEVWRASGIRSAWNTPFLIDEKPQAEMVVSCEERLNSFNPDDGKPL